MWAVATRCCLSVELVDEELKPSLVTSMEKAGSVRTLMMPDDALARERNDVARSIEQLEEAHKLLESAPSLGVSLQELSRIASTAAAASADEGEGSRLGENAAAPAAAASAQAQAAAAGAPVAFGAKSNGPPLTLTPLGGAGAGFSFAASPTTDASLRPQGGFSAVSPPAQPALAFGAGAPAANPFAAKQAVPSFGGGLFGGGAPAAAAAPAPVFTFKHDANAPPPAILGAAPPADPAKPVPKPSGFSFADGLAPPPKP